MYSRLNCMGKKFSIKNNYVNNILLLTSIGMPGIVRLVVVFLINSYGKLEAVGEYSNDLNIAIILSTISSVGFASVVMNRIPQANTEQQDSILIRNIASGLVILVPLIFLIGLLKNFDLVFNWKGIAIYMVGITTYQIIRQYFYALGKYRKCLIYDFSSLFAIVLAMIVTSGFNALIIQGVVLILASFPIIFIKLKNSKIIFNRSEIVSGLGFGFSNLSSAILVLISVPLAQKLLGIEYAGFLGLINPCLGIIFLLPRGLSVYYIPKLVRLGVYKGEQKTAFITYFMRNISLLISVLVATYLLWLVFIFIFPNSNVILQYSNTILVIILINTFLSQLSLPFFGLLNACDESKVSFHVNFISLLSFFVLLTVLKYLGVNGFSGFMNIYSWLIAVYFARIIFLWWYIWNKFKNSIG